MLRWPTLPSRSSRLETNFQPRVEVLAIRCLALSDASLSRRSWMLERRREKMALISAQLVGVACTTTLLKTIALTIGSTESLRRISCSTLRLFMGLEYKPTSKSISCFLLLLRRVAWSRANLMFRYFYLSP
jgi:hypothetical protein